ncbi:cysteine/serine-rich nuclear protein 3 [Pelodiscus sinensis]|uniref:Cysteine and serine rich nuclear protein 3 n=1 Tax=Pelodiscus sinensis TaxID=13735 RepID=K7GJH6_PELSI|nr:cysteine/serine-rich nuclear protein 3 isoform X2 [Pelodiscus sinensis]XP_006124858.1 cysteine/serine-rich nuclear protein 3 isoform X2 [Pelodiscus sinensis]XP_006124859.1 cysteine/serine-rich nuclear protein 3 isoform X2 [Pelodiscus sinensis]|eukprot:XP_006124857.1 cysteine/serine-rich nuclear protein 3 isoform X2 [Pelodiscus sinensis]
MSGILKRKFEEVDGSSPCSSVRESDDDISSSESADSGDSVNPSTSNHFTPSSILKREKRKRTKNVHFNCVTVYYFTRRQGFTSVPSQGGSTLGMSTRHNSMRQYTLGEFAMEQERLHREMLRDHLREEKLNSLKLKMTKNGTVESEDANTLTLDDISDDDIDLDNTEVDEYFFLQPLPTKKRRALLRASGVKKIDVEEKHELRAIRLSREDCGCDCRVFCDPETCTCSLAGIKCQVDRMSFPCGCTKEGCSNTAGRIEFNPIRVRTHFLHTIMKLELEKNREQPVTPLNGCHTEVSAHTSSMSTAPHAVEYSLAENFEIDADPQAAVMHLQSAEDLDCPGEEEEEEEEDGSSFCSGVTDSSTSLAPSESDDEDEEEEEEEKADEFVEGLGSHADVVPLPSVLCYSDGTAVHESHSKNASYYANSSTLYYQIENHVPGSNNQIAETFSERDMVKNSSLSLVPYNMTSEQFVNYTRQSDESYSSSHYPSANPSVIVCCSSSESDNSVPCNSLYTEHRPSHPQVEFHSYLKSTSQDGFVSALNGDSHIPEQAAENSISLSEKSRLHEECIKSSVVETVPV